jgi:hypothetical protein
MMTSLKDRSVCGGASELYDMSSMSYSNSYVADIQYVVSFCPELSQAITTIR